MRKRVLKLITIKILHSLIAYLARRKKKKKGLIFFIYELILIVNYILNFSKNIRPDWKKERQTNQETFGHSAVRSLAFRRSGRAAGSGFRFPAGKNRVISYRSGPLSNYQAGGSYQNYNTHVNNNYNQNNRRHTQRNGGGGIDIDGGMNNYRRRTVGARLRAF